MKFINLLMTLFLFWIGLASCHKDKEMDLLLEADQTKLTIGAASDEVELHITSNIQWKLETPEWVTADKTSGKGDETITIKVQELTNADVRHGVIKLKAINNSTIEEVWIAVEQKTFRYVTGWEGTIALGDWGYCAGLVAAADGSSYVMGRVSGNESRLVLAKIDQNGAVSWKKDFDKAAMPAYGKLIATEDGVIFLADIVENFSNHFKAVKIKADGTPGWATELDIDPNHGCAIMARNNGSVITGSRNNILFTIDLDNTGTIQKHIAYNGFSNERYISGMAFTPAGDLLVSGDYMDNGYVIKFNKQRNIEWDKQFTYGPLTFAAAVSALPDGTITVAGDYNITGDNTDLFLCKMKAGGSLIWREDFGTDETDAITHFAATDAGYFIGGSEGKASGSGMWFMQLNNTGQIVWDKLVSGTTPAGISNAYMVPVQNGMIVAGTVENSIWYANLIQD